jgi:hypothetical protein
MKVSLGFVVVAHVFMLAPVVVEASAAPLYFSCSGTHQWTSANKTPMSVVATVSVMLDLDKRRFSWTANTATGPNCRESDAEWKFSRGETNFVICSDAWATDLEYNFSVTNYVADRECHGKSCELKGSFVDTTTKGKINRLTGELSATQDYVVYREGKVDETSFLHDEWQMTCTLTDRRF